jgi:ATP-dependent DNA helicase RecG
LRTLNRFESAPNLDIGEGVDRMFKVMTEKNLYEPLYFPPTVRPNTVLLMLLNIQKVEYWDTVSKFLDENFRITNKEARDITGISDTIKMSRLLKLWVDKGLLEKMDSKFKGGVSYKKVGVSIPRKLNHSFARGTANGK